MLEQVWVEIGLPNAGCRECSRNFGLLAACRIAGLEIRVPRPLHPAAVWIEHIPDQVRSRADVGHPSLKLRFRFPGSPTPGMNSLRGPRNCTGPTFIVLDHRLKRDWEETYQI